MRVAGLIIKENKLLTVKICENTFYCLPGGHVHLGESSLDAIKREMKEEVEHECKKATLLTIAENFFVNQKGQKFHEVCYFYLYQPIEDVEIKDYTRVENDEGELVKLEFKWVDLNSLKDVDFRPTFLIDKLSKGDFSFEHIIFEG